MTTIKTGDWKEWAIKPRIKLAISDIARTQNKQHDHALFSVKSVGTDTMDNFLKVHLRCPDCHGDFDLNSVSCSLRCVQCDTEYPIIGNRPILLSSHNELFSKQEIYDAIGDRGNNANGWVQRMIPGISVNLAGKSMLEKFGDLLSCKPNTSHVLVVGSGTQRNWLDGRFSNRANVKLVYCDIDPKSLVDCYCDAHELPFVDASFDGVIVTAVLEHVLYPERVSTEIFRVLKSGGLFYSELPFMQQVHEGAYDFTRYTLSGHRKLFNSFTEIEAGLVAGPGTALAWSLENFFLSFFTDVRLHKIVKAVGRLSFFWIKYFDYVFKDKPQAMDGASCTFFLGKKDKNVKVSDKHIMNKYFGAKYIQHI